MYDMIQLTDAVGSQSEPARAIVHIIIYTQKSEVNIETFKFPIISTDRAYRAVSRTIAFAKVCFVFNKVNNILNNI